MNEREFTEQRWRKVEKEERYFKLYPGLYIVVSIPENKGKAVIESEKYGKLELHFGLSRFDKVIDIEIFIINFFKDKL
jgi:hypothetical protein